MKSEKKRTTHKFTIFMMKDYVDDFELCLKNPDVLSSSSVKADYGMEAVIYYSDSKKNYPRWKAYLDALSEDKIDFSENTSNKAVLLSKVKGRIMALTFGYGRSFLEEDCIDRSFGLRTALNTINHNKLRSINAAVVEDLVVTTQRQASHSTSQNEFGLNVINDIMRGVAGDCYDEKIGIKVSGTDSLNISVKTDLSNLKDLLDAYYDAYYSDRYKEIGFEWIDNIKEVRDTLLVEQLDNSLVDSIEEGNIDHLHTAPPEIVDWNNIVGFAISGIGRNCNNPDNYDTEIELASYIDYLKQHNKTSNYIQKKLRSDKLKCIDSDDNIFTLCNVYNALVFQLELKGVSYILCSGKWYEIEASFFERVENYINNQIEISNIMLPDCPGDFVEGEYNKLVADQNDNYCLMDQVFFSAEGSPRKIEACDIFANDCKLIHVKNYTKSSQLSHLFSQGRVAAECFMEDRSFRKQVYETAKPKLGEQVFNYQNKPEPYSVEVVYAIIFKREGTLETMLPFFSKVNLMLAAQGLERINCKCSVCLVKKQ